MSDLSKLGEARIDEAIANGSLKPPPAGTEIDLEGYFRTPAAWRAGFSMLKGNGFVPPELDLLRRAGELEERLAGTEDADEQGRLKAEIEQLKVSFRLAAERLGFRPSPPAP